MQSFASIGPIPIHATKVWGKLKKNWNEVTMKKLTVPWIQFGRISGAPHGPYKGIPSKFHRILNSIFTNSVIFRQRNTCEMFLGFIFVATIFHKTSFCFPSWPVTTPYLWTSTWRDYPTTFPINICKQQLPNTFSIITVSGIYKKKEDNYNYIYSPNSACT